jgi:proprotein convertase subtilisin/kexin type 5
MIVWSFLLLLCTTNACITGCLSYNSSCKCQTCLTGYTLDLNGTYCCVDSYARNCSRCNQNNTCSECTEVFVGPRYGINSSSKCDLCHNFLPGCYECKTYMDGCIRCGSNYRMNASNNNVCVPCYSYMPYCSICDSTTGCISCNTSSRIAMIGTNSSVCALCSQYLTYCASCKNSTYCYYCINSSYAVYRHPTSFNHTCLNCSYWTIDCETCSSNGSCLTCREKYYYY